MSLIQEVSVCDFSSENKKYKADNLLQKDEESWRCDRWQKNAWIIVEVSEQHVLERLEITNAYSAFIEVFVSDKADADNRVLVPTFCSMSPRDSKERDNGKTKFVFKTKHFSPYAATKEWKNLKIYCIQPFNKSIRFGLSFIRLYGHRKTNTPARQISLFGEFKLKEAPNNLNKDAFSSFDLKYKKDLIGQKNEERLKLTLPEECEENGAKKEERAEGKEEKPMNGKGSRKDKGKKRNESEEEDGGSSERKKARKMEKPIKETSATSGTAGSSGRDTARPSGNDTFSSMPSTSAAAMADQARHSKKKKSGSSKPFERLMEHVVFVLSGFTNPLRSQLREQCTSMGAKYEPNWGPNCTHLICAVANTPKFKEVKRLNGRIVSSAFIEDSYARRRLCEWRNYMMGTYEGPDTEDEENGAQRRRVGAETAGTSVAANDKASVAAASSSKRTTNGYDSDEIYDMDTESEDDD